MFPYEIKPLGGKVGEEFLRQFKGIHSGVVEVGSKKWILPAQYAKHADKYYNFKVRPDDLWIITFPRSGTTFMQELLWLIDNNMDFEAASKEVLLLRSRQLELEIKFSDEFLQDIAEQPGQDLKEFEKFKFETFHGIEILNEMKSPRHIKTHIALSLLPPALKHGEGKIVYIARNPYDVIVSNYHHNKLLRINDFQGDFKQYWEYFEKNLIVYTPYWEHLKEGWELRNNKNCLFLFYEDIITDLPGNIKKIAKFLNKQITQEQVNKLTEHLQIDNFRKNVGLFPFENLKGISNTNKQEFIRRGKIGGNSEYDDELKPRVDKWFRENLAKTDIKFPKFECYL